MGKMGGSGLSAESGGFEVVGRFVDDARPEGYGAYLQTWRWDFTTDQRTCFANFPQ
jgi:hypothetical protein